MLRWAILCKSAGTKCYFKYCLVYNPIGSYHGYQTLRLWLYEPISIDFSCGIYTTNVNRVEFITRRKRCKHHRRLALRNEKKKPVVEESGKGTTRNRKVRKRVLTNNVDFVFFRTETHNYSYRSIPWMHNHRYENLNIIF